jgi:hypothetical protein
LQHKTVTYCEVLNSRQDYEVAVLKARMPNEDEEESDRFPPNFIMRDECAHFENLLSYINLMFWRMTS